MNSKIILASILPVISISSGIILNHHLNNQFQKNKIANKRIIKKNLSSNKKNLNNKIKNNSFNSHKSFNAFNIKSKANKNSDLQYKDVSVVLNYSFNKHIVFPPYIYHFYYKQYEKNKNGIYQLVSHDAKIWTHSKTIHVAYPFLNSTYVKIVGVRGSKNNLQINQNFKLSINDLKNAFKNTLKINVDAIGLVSNPHIYLDYHYKLKSRKKINLINKKHNLNKNKFNKNNDDYFGQNLTNLRSHFNNYQIKMFGYYKVFNLNLSAKSWFTNNLINALLMLLPITIDIFANMFCGIVSGLIMGSITSQIKNFIISFNLNLIDSTLTKGYLGYAYMAGDTLFTMGESEMEFIASGIGDFFVTGKSINGMSKTFSDEKSKTEVIEYAGDDDMREKLDDSDNISVSTNQSFAYSHNGLEQDNNNNNIQSSLDNQAQNLHSNMNIATQASDHNENSNLIMLEDDNNILINNNDEQPVVAEENSYGQYSSELIINHHSSRIIQEDPHRGIDDDSDTDSVLGGENNSGKKNNFTISLTENEDGTEITKNTEDSEEETDDDNNSLILDSELETDSNEYERQLDFKTVFLIPALKDFDPNCLKFVDLDTIKVFRSIEDLILHKQNPTLTDKIKYFEYVISRMNKKYILEEYYCPIEIDFEELAAKQILSLNVDSDNFFENLFSESITKYTRKELLNPWINSSLIDYLLSDEEPIEFNFIKFIQSSSLEYMKQHIDYSEAKLFLYRIKIISSTIYFEWLKDFGNEENIIKMFLSPDYEIRKQLFLGPSEDYPGQRKMLYDDIVDPEKTKGFEFMTLNHFYYLIIAHGDYSLEFYNSLCFKRNEFKNSCQHYDFIHDFVKYFGKSSFTLIEASLGVGRSNEFKFQELEFHKSLNDKIKFIVEIQDHAETDFILDDYNFRNEINYERLNITQMGLEDSLSPLYSSNYIFPVSKIKFIKAELFKPWIGHSLIEYLLAKDEYGFDFIKFTQLSSPEYMGKHIAYAEARLFLYRFQMDFAWERINCYTELLVDFGGIDKVSHILADPNYTTRKELFCGPTLENPGFRSPLWYFDGEHANSLLFSTLKYSYYWVISKGDYSFEFYNSLVIARRKNTLNSI